jgi:CheY-like chemotaxis protein
MQDHEGAITVYSELGAGTAFRLYFPLPPDTLGLYEDMVTQPESIPTGTGTILLVDDEAMIRKTAGTMLERLGYKVLFARDGLEALEIYQACREEIGIVLMDMIMPKLGGRQTFARLRELDHTLPIVICSGFSKVQDLDALKEKGISGFLQKPFRRAQLAQAVSASIRKSYQGA